MPRSTVAAIRAMPWLQSPQTRKAAAACVMTGRRNLPYLVA
jgi:hypothetical protein